MSRFRRLESWSDVQAAGGYRLALRLTPLKAQGVTDRRQLNGDDTLTFTVSLNDPAVAALRHRGVIRVSYDDETFDEWRITDIGRTRQMRSKTMLVTCAPLLRDLNEICLIKRVESDGLVSHQFGADGLTLQQHLNAYILPSLAAEGRGYWVAGQIDADAVLPTFVYDWDTPLGALRRLAGDTHELRARAQVVGGVATSYAIDLASLIGADAPTVTVRLGTNLRGLSRTLSSQNQATRIYPSGSPDEDGFRADMSEATWAVTAISPSTREIGLSDPAGGVGPVIYDDQLNWSAADPVYCRRPNGTLTLVEDTVAIGQILTLTSVSGLVVGDLVRFRRGAGGERLTFLESPVDRLASGLKVAQLDRPDLPVTDNLLTNGAFRVWPLGNTLPDGAAVIGTPVVSRATSAAFTKVGGQSIQMSTTVAGHGLSWTVAVAPTDIHPNFAALWPFFWVTAGQLRFEVWFTAGGVTTIRPSGTDAKAVSGAVGTWSQVGIEFANGEALALGATTMTLVAVQDGPAAVDCYIDAVQLTQSSSQQPFVDGSGPRALWQAANARLALYAPPSVEISGDMLDFGRAAPDAFPHDQLVVGGRVRLLDSELQADVTTRVIGWTRDHLRGLITAIELSNRPEDLTDALTRPSRPDALLRAGTVTPIPTVSLFQQADRNVIGSVRYQLSAQPSDAGIYYLLLDLADVVPPIGDAAWRRYAGPNSVPASTTPVKLVAYAKIGATTSSVYAWQLNVDGQASVTGQLIEGAGGTFEMSWIPDGDTSQVTVYYLVTPAASPLVGLGYPTVNGTLGTAPLPAALAGYRDVDVNGRGVLFGSEVGGGTAETFGGTFATGDRLGVLLVPRGPRGIGPAVGLIATKTGTAGKSIGAFSVTALTIGTPDTLSVSWGLGGSASNSDTLRFAISVNGGAFFDTGVVVTSPVTNTTATISTTLDHDTSKFAALAIFRLQATLYTGSTAVVSRLAGEKFEDTVASLLL